MIRVACRDCGRVLGEDGWRAPQSDLDYAAPRQGICPADLILRRADAERKWKREGRELLTRRRKGYGPPADGADVFKGFKGE